MSAAWPWTPGPWSVFSMVDSAGNPLTADGFAGYARATFEKSLSESGSSRFLFVSAVNADNADVDVCWVGNGPLGPRNARVIAAAPEMAGFIERLLREMDVQVAPAAAFDVPFSTPAARHWFALRAEGQRLLERVRGDEGEP